MANFRYIGKAQPKANGKYTYRVRSCNFSIEFLPDEVFSISDTETRVLQYIRGQMEYDWDTRGQIKAYEEVL